MADLPFWTEEGELELEAAMDELEEQQSSKTKKEDKAMGRDCLKKTKEALL